MYRCSYQLLFSDILSAYFSHRESGERASEPIIWMNGENFSFVFWYIILNYIMNLTIGLWSCYLYDVECWGDCEEWIGTDLEASGRYTL
jgi:hypothetical protein